MQRLLKAGADHDNSNKNGDVPLQLAAGQGHQAIVQCFLYAGADKDAADTFGRTLLHIAGQEGYQAVVQCL